MQQTKKLYDDNAYCREFTSEVLEVTSTENGDNIILSATAFFPEEGGQSCDTGTLDGYPVVHVSLDPNGVITHTFLNSVHYVDLQAAVEANLAK